MGDIVPEEVITDIIVNYPSSHILVVTTSSKQKVTSLLSQLKGFKNFKYEKLDGKVLKKSLAGAFKVQDAAADSLSEYHKTDENLLDSMDVEQFEPKAYLGD